MQQKDWMLLALGAFILYLLADRKKTSADTGPAVATLEAGAGSPSERAAEAAEMGNICPSIIIPMGDASYGDILTKGQIYG